MEPIKGRLNVLQLSVARSMSIQRPPKRLVDATANVAASSHRPPTEGTANSIRFNNASLTLWFCRSSEPERLRLFRVCAALCSF